MRRSSESHSAPMAAAVARGTGLSITMLAGVNQRLAISGWMRGVQMLKMRMKTATAISA